MKDCPTTEQLAAFVEGACPQDQVERIRAHVEQCSQCAKWVEQAESDDQALREIQDDQNTRTHASGAEQEEQVRHVQSPATRERKPELPTTIEGYEIIRELHRGGQGVVYQAVQQSTKRKVAIKVLLEGPYASKSAKKRFEREIELVAQLKHPNIITIYHSGMTRDGQHFFVMDYVRGKPLNAYVRETKPTLEDTLQLFGAVCEAVQYAHQRGIIHRDLKPSNILVDVDGKVKLLDFGLAKLVGAPLQTLLSITQQVVGTLPYMSPEQTRGNPDEIDTRTDVYALGVILYEILTGHYPYPVTGQMTEVLKHIVETPPAARAAT